jgi:hypothetical protein
MPYGDQEKEALTLSVVAGTAGATAQFEGG